MWSLKGGLLRELGRYGDAVACYDAAIDLAPQNPDFWLGKGRALKGLGKFELALASFRKELELNPGDRAALYERAYVLAKLGRQPPEAASPTRAVTD